MSTFEINDYLLAKECEELAREIVDDFRREYPGEDLSDYRDEMSDRAHEVADSHSWAIYNHQALMICAHCDVSSGEELLEDIGLPQDPTIYSIACLIAFGEMRARIESAIDEILEEESDEESDEESN